MGKWLNYIFMPRHKQWQMYYAIQSEILSVHPSVRANIQGLGAILGYFGHNSDVF